MTPDSTPLDRLDAAEREAETFFTDGEVRVRRNDLRALIDVAQTISAERLNDLADWLDLDDARNGRIGHEVQDDLRLLASRLAPLLSPTDEKTP
jgi:hypothetical protein